MNVFLFKKNSCGTSIARASLGHRRGVVVERASSENAAAATAARHPPPTTHHHRRQPQTTLAATHKSRDRACVGGPPGPVSGGLPAPGRYAHSWSVAAAVVVSYARTPTVRRVYMQSTSGSSTSRRCSLCCSVWRWWSFVFGSRAPTDDTSPRPTDSDGRGPRRRKMQGRVLLL